MSESLFKKRWIRLWIPSESATVAIESVTLKSANGFRIQTELVGLITRRPGPGEETTRHSFRQILPSTTVIAPDPMREGTLQAPDGPLSWKLRLTAGALQPLLPGWLAQAMGSKGQWQSRTGGTRAEGEIAWKGGGFEFKDAIAVTGEYSGTQAPRDSIWFSCPEAPGDGIEGSLSIEGVTTLERPWHLPFGVRPRAMRIQLRSRSFRTESPWDCVQCRIQDSPAGCDFEFSKASYQFRGQVRVPTKELTGLSFENTDGNLLHRVTTDRADIEVRVFDGHKLQGTYRAKGQASWEKTTLEKNPYVLFLS